MAAPVCTPLAGLATQLVFVTQPTNTFAGSPIIPAPVAEALPAVEEDDELDLLDGAPEPEVAEENDPAETPNL